MGPQGIQTRTEPPDPAAVARAAALLRAGDLVAFPTETVYGLGADASSGAAVARIYAAKERPRFNPLISHLPTADAAFVQGAFDGAARRLAEAFWPGPLTLVVPAGAGCTVCDLARAGLPSVALRVPGHPVARALLTEAAVPVAAPSANRSGRISPTEAAHVAAELDGRCAMILDGGPTRVGLESTVVACLDGTVRVLRPGGISRADLERVLGFAPDAATGRVIAPGMLSSHYAPSAAVRMDADHAGPGEAVLDFGRRLGFGTATAYVDLSPSGRLEEAAANLFSALRRLDAGGPARIAIAPIPKDGIGEAINDRLARAAAPRS